MVVAGVCLLGPPLVTPAESVLPEAVVPSDRAQNVRVWQETRVTYTVVEPYPAERLLKELGGKLEVHGFVALDYDPRNPHLRNSAVHQWTEFVDAQRGDRRIRLEQWTGWFADAEGNRVMLLLQYVDRGMESEDEVTVVVLHDVGEQSSAVETQRQR